MSCKDPRIQGGGNSPPAEVEQKKSVGETFSPKNREHAEHGYWTALGKREEGGKMALIRAVWLTLQGLGEGKKEQGA